MKRNVAGNRTYDGRSFLGREFCQERHCPYLVKAPLPPGQKRTRKVICSLTGYMPGHMITCPHTAREG